MTLLADLASLQMGQQFSEITADSRKVTAGALFLAYPGAASDGRHYIAQALKAGAVAVLWEKEGFTWHAEWNVPNVAVSGLKHQVGQIAADYYQHPSSQMAMIGVTGTNGKTSVSQWLAQCLSHLGQKSAVLGTIGNGIISNTELAVATNTTPDAILLQGMLADFVQQDVKNVAMEVSSHGLDQNRVNGVEFDVAVLTNLSRDHLDYHETMEAYAAAKQKLFTNDGLKMRVLNADDAFGQALVTAMQAQGKAFMTYGLESGDVRGENLQLLANGLSMHVITPQGDALLAAPVLGRFNAYNVLAVLTTLLALDVNLQDALAAIAKLKPVQGRMQQFGGGALPLVVIDYAHTPDALEKVLSTLREQVQGAQRLLCVFGCGGDRDAGKRPLMGAVAAKLADVVIVTSDNPRSENPDAIIGQIVHGLNAAYQIEADREHAIQLAVSMAKSGDIVLVAGKGHEDYQEISGVKTPFSDAQVAQAVLAQDQSVAATLSSAGFEMMLLSEAAKAINAELIGADGMLTSVNTDSRQVVPSQLFVALKGEHFDGHDYAQQAIEQGAAAVLVSHAIAGAEPALVVADTYQALGELAAYWRSKFTLPVVAITGSNGKTTVKEMLASILRAAAGNADAVLATQGNLNNHIGLPLTLLKLTTQHRYAVIEMGMNHTGEIRYLTNIAKPTVALINNAGNAHLGELGSFEAIANAKAEIFEGLADDGVAVINADDVFAPLWIGLNSQRKIISFGLKNSADVTATYQLEAAASVLEITTPLGLLNVHLPTPGAHNVMNALAATAAAIGMDVPLSAIALGLETYAGVKGRLQHLAGQQGALVIDDTYNANPMSMKAAIDVLVARPGKKLLVLGDMGELGEDAAEMHAEIGRYAKAAGVDALLTLGELSAEMSREFGAGAQHYATPQALTVDLLAQMNVDSTVLVKGSRFMAMERIVRAIVAASVVDFAAQKESNNMKGTH